MLRLVHWSLFALLVSLPLATRAQTAWVDVHVAEQALEDFRVVCEKDAGHLWGASLCGPVMLVDQTAHVLVANAHAGAPDLSGLFVTVWPASENVSATAIEWAGLWWAQVPLPLPSNVEARRVSLVHESFHRLANSQKWPGFGGMTGVGNGHLDTLEGRYFILLEWRALARALESQGASRRSAIEDALAFRGARRERFASATVDESAGEWAEGLAEYTGVKLAADDAEGQRALAKADIETGAQRESFVRAFPYAAGPAYGLLLDEAGAEWRDKARGGADLGVLLASAVSLAPPRATPGEIARRAKAYGGPAIRAMEEERERLAKKRIADLRQKLVVGPVLILPLEKPRIQLNPGTLVPMADLGTVYPTARLAAQWGAITVTKDLLLAGDWKQATVAAPSEGAGQTWRGDGWTLELKEGWSLGEGPRPRDRRVVLDARTSPQ